MFKLLKKIRRKKKSLIVPEHQQVNPSEEYTLMMDTVMRVANDPCESKEEKLFLLQCICKAIKKDYQADLLTTLLYRGEVHLDPEIQLPLPFPLWFTDQKGEEISLLNLDSPVRRIALSKENIYVLPWRQDRLFSAFKHVREKGFIFNRTNHLAHYFEHIDLCVIYNGRHHTSAGILMGTGEIEAKVYDLTKIYPIMDINQELDLFSVHDGKIYREKLDFRIASLYTISKLCWELENESEAEGGENGETK